MVEDDGALETGVLLRVVVPEDDLQLDGLHELSLLVRVDVLAVGLLADELVGHHLVDLLLEEVVRDLQSAGWGETGWAAITSLLLKRFVLTG